MCDDLTAADDDAALAAGLIHRQSENASLQRIERRDRQLPAITRMADDIGRHLLVGTVVLRERGRLILVLDDLLAGQLLMYVCDGVHNADF